MNRPFENRCLRLSAAALAASTLLGGCGMWNSLTGGGNSSDEPQYRSPIASRGKPLDVPPDLTQLSRETANRYAQQGGVISAAATPASGAVAAVPSSQTPVAPQVSGDIRIERDGNERWLVVPAPPEQLWPQIRAFWVERGFTIASENAETGVMETGWAENRAKLPQDIIRRTIGSVFENIYDTGERDRFRTRIERGTNGSEVFVSHRGMQEIYVGQSKENTTWQWRPSDPQLEAEMLSLLMAKLSAKPVEATRTVVAAAPETPARARAVSGGSGAALEVDEPFDRAWRRVGLALDRGGFTVEDRDRAAGLYYVRYVDPKDAAKEEPGFFSRLFGGGKDNTRPLRYRIAVKGSTDKTMVSVLNAEGAPDNGENAQRIVGQLVTELR